MQIGGRGIFLLLMQQIGVLLVVYEIARQDGCASGEGGEMSAFAPLDEEQEGQLSAGACGLQDPSGSFATLPTMAGRACDAKVSPRSRVFLLTDAQAQHGSTALMSLLETSSRISTLCQASRTQCEGFPLVRKRLIQKGLAKLGEHFIPFKLFTDQGFDVLNELGKHWDLGRPILVDKIFPDEEGWTQALLEARFRIPRVMQGAGIGEIRIAVIMMWMPLCVLSVRNHSWVQYKFQYQREYRSPAMTEVIPRDKLQRDHLWLRSQGIATLVVNYGDLIWRPRRVKQRVETFLPCIGGLKIDTEDEAISHIAAANSKFKVHVSSKSFGSEHDPQECCGYDVAAARCPDQAYAQVVPRQLGIRAKQVDNYFRRLV
mmetsp:Transcript_63480/g.151374  ORF Transcript_63480/g.151374 Transcript_63480/m.151374 type:complete len:373 (+) Transcript_63480:184-1302(+)